MEKDFTKGMLIGLAAGAITGAILGVMFAPQSGKETREMISDKMDKLKDIVARKLNHLGKFTKEKYDQVADETIDAYLKSKEISPDEADKIRQDIEEGYEKIRKALNK